MQHDTLNRSSIMQNVSIKWLGQKSEMQLQNRWVMGYYKIIYHPCPKGEKGHVTCLKTPLTLNITRHHSFIFIASILHRTSVIYPQYGCTHITFNVGDLKKLTYLVFSKFQIFGHNPTNHEIHPFMRKTAKKLFIRF